MSRWKGEVHKGVVRGASQVPTTPRARVGPDVGYLELSMRHLWNRYPTASVPIR
jgi:hypothetical protein